MTSHDAQTAAELAETQAHEATRQRERTERQARRTAYAWSQQAQRYYKAAREATADPNHDTAALNAVTRYMRRRDEAHAGGRPPKRRSPRRRTLRDPRPETKAELANKTANQLVKAADAHRAASRWLRHLDELAADRHANQARDLADEAKTLREQYAN